MSRLMQSTAPYAARRCRGGHLTSRKDEVSDGDDGLSEVRILSHLWQGGRFCRQIRYDAFPVRNGVIARRPCRLRVPLTEVLRS